MRRAVLSLCVNSWWDARLVLLLVLKFFCVYWTEFVDFFVCKRIRQKRALDFSETSDRVYGININQDNHRLIFNDTFASAPTFSVLPCELISYHTNYIILRRLPRAFHDVLFKFLSTNFDLLTLLLKKSDINKKNRNQNVWHLSHLPNIPHRFALQ